MYRPYSVPHPLNLPSSSSLPKGHGMNLCTSHEQGLWRHASELILSHQNKAKLGSLHTFKKEGVQLRISWGKSLNKNDNN